MSQSETTARLRRYSVSVEGYGAEKFTAKTASAARYAAYRAFRDAGWRITFADFLRRCSTLHLGLADHG